MTQATSSQIEAAVKSLMAHIERTCVILTGQQPKLEQAIVDLIIASRTEPDHQQATPSISAAADARREIGKWLNEEQVRPVDREALAQLCAAFDALTRPQEVAEPVGGIKRWTHYEDDFDHFEDPDGDWVTYADHVASHVQKVAAAGPMTSIDDMCAILKRRHINASEYTDCTILYQVTFEQLRAIYDEGRATGRAQEVVRADWRDCWGREQFLPTLSRAVASLSAPLQKGDYNNFDIVSDAAILASTSPSAVSGGGES